MSDHEKSASEGAASPAPSTSPSPQRIRRAAPAGVRRGLQRWIGAYTGEHGIYGVVLVTALVAIGEDYDNDLDVLLFVVGTMVVFWLAHVYAGYVATGGDPAHRAAGVSARLSHSFRHPVGMLVAMTPPMLILALGAFDLIDDDLAYDLALLSGVVVLALIGYANAARSGRRVGGRILETLVTASLGLLVIALSILAH